MDFLEAYDLNPEEAAKDTSRLLTAAAQLPPLKPGVDFSLAYIWLNGKLLEKAHGYVSSFGGTPGVAPRN